MAFENLSEKLQRTFSNLKSRGKLSEKDIKAAMREIKLALLEADVNFLIVKEFIKNVTEKATGQAVLKSLTPGQMVVKIVNEELQDLMGGSISKLEFVSPPTIIMLCGLQGAGKTTMAGKLAKFIKQKNKKPLLVACDVYRPAAIEQLKVVGEKVDVDVFSLDSKDPINIAKQSITYANKKANDVVIIDTAGRLHLDEDLMGELKNIKAEVKPREILFVVDAMTGQDAVNIATKFNEDLDITGVILTKLDGDARGGAALSIKKSTNKPIKFIGVGEKMDDIEEFHPDRMASRILGMGDTLSLIEKVQKNFDEENMKKLEAKLKKNKFDLNDFLAQLQQMKKMGPMGDLLKMLPGNMKKMKDIQVDEKELIKVEAIIQSMTIEERERPEIINGSRRKRIALGSGTNVSDVNKLLKQHANTKKLIKQFNSPKMGKMMNGGGFPFM